MEHFSISLAYCFGSKAHNLALVSLLLFGFCFSPLDQAVKEDVVVKPCVVEEQAFQTLFWGKYIQVSFSVFDQIWLLIIYMQFLCPGDHWKWSYVALPGHLDVHLVVLAHRQKVERNS